MRDEGYTSATLLAEKTPRVPAFGSAPVFGSGRSRLVGVSLFALSAWAGVAPAQAQNAPVATPGTEIANTAFIRYAGGPDQGVPTNRVVFTVAAPRPGVGLPPQIDFLRYDPNAPDAQLATVAGSDYSPSGAASGPFTPIGAPVRAGGETIPADGPVPLRPASTFLTGESLFVRVTDCGASADPEVIETVTVSIAGEAGDLITLRLYENGPDSCEFFAHVPSTAATSAPDDRELTTPPNEVLTATYQDALTGADTVIDTALIDPLNRVFSTATGELLDGATITLVDAATGAPAQTLGVDGRSAFPAEQVSGLDVSDASGSVYTSGPGEFRFPNVGAGEYAIRVDPPEGFTFSSSLDADTITVNTDGSFLLTEASFGRNFLQEFGGPLRFDIPLDPISELVIDKRADRASADVGDYVTYTVTVENRGLQTVPLRVTDTLPLGFRYVPGTSRVAGETTSDPDVSETGAQLTYTPGNLLPGERVEIDYTLNVGPAAPLGDAVNTAVASDLAGVLSSNVARAELRLREELFRTRSTIIGRVSDDVCDLGSITDGDWPRELNFQSADGQGANGNGGRGIGVPGVRLYMETGAYAVTDADGLYHFEDVREGTHVVQVDLETLPPGYALVPCESTTRTAGRAFSTFVDVQGGGIWRANFTIARTEAVVAEDVPGATAPSAAASSATAPSTSDPVTSDPATSNADAPRGTAGDAPDRAAPARIGAEYDAAWLAGQSSAPGIVYPAPEQSLARPSLDMGVKHAPGQTVQLRLNGRLVDARHVSARVRGIGNSVVLTRWSGVDVQPGTNSVTVEVRDADGALVESLEREVAFVTQLSRARAVPDLSNLVADGRSVPTLAVRLEDEAGRPLFAGRQVRVDLEAPYLLRDPLRDIRIENTREIDDALAARDVFEVGADGLLQVPLEPTLQTGRATLIVTTDSGRQIPLTYYLEPEKRDWILVGLAEGTAGFETVRDQAIDLGNRDSDDDLETDGRVAFFAKGLIKGEWLMTLAVDTDRRRSGLGNRDGAFNSEIDPNAYYTLYGDRSYQQFEGVSRYPVYVKLEKRQGYALFGDFDTDIQDSRLTAYTRRLSGLKAEYVGERVSVMGFAAETNQGFALDEIAAESVSGPYFTSRQRVLPQSEEVVIETRDRVRPDIVLERRPLVRYLDYTLDYFTGELIFRLPVDATDAAFNPNVIVVSYETSEDAERNITFGGRAEAEVARRTTVGVTGVREDGSALEADADSAMVGVDLHSFLTDSTEVRAEYAVSEDLTRNDRADAILGEIVHTSDGVQTEAYYRREEPGFGLGQRTTNTLGAERYGVRADVRVHQTENVETGRRAITSLGAAAYHEESLVTGNQRQNGEITARRDGPKLDVIGGLRFTRDEFTDGETRDSMIATGTVQYALPEHGANVSVSREQALGGDNDEVSIYPTRTVLGLDKTLGRRAVATLRHEITEGAQADARNTALGLQLTPWSGGQLSVSSDMITQDSARRIGATVGLDQQVRLSDKWTASAGVRSRRVVDGEGDFRQPVPDAAISPFERNEDFNSAYVGAGYRTESTAASARLEGRSASDGDTYIATVGAAREVSETLSLATSARGFLSEPQGSSKAASNIDVRLGLAWRPRDERTVIFDRLDVSDAKSPLGLDSNKVVNNFALNTQINERWQATGNWGVKYVQTDLLDREVSGWTHLLGAETRYDLFSWLDLGARGQLLTGDAGTRYSYGPDIGVSPVDNVWVSLGYNVSGYDDDDFEAAEFSREGLYLRMRFRFDQESARGLLRWISPSASATEAATAAPPATP